MLLKRIYADDGSVSAIEIKHTGTSREQNFSHRLIEQAIVDGWARLDGDTLTLRGQPEDLTYSVRRSPGYYCTSTGERIPVSAMAWASPQRGTLARKEALAWLAARGKPAGDYEVTNAYECVLDEAQHHQFHAVRDAKGRVVGAHELEA
jgi:hypothetical protein